MLGIAVYSQNPPNVFLYYTESSTGNGNRVYRYD